MVVRLAVAAALAVGVLGASAVVAPAARAGPSVGCADPMVAAAPCPARPVRAAAAGAGLTYTWSVATRGTVRSSAEDFASWVAAVYADPRGWGLGGSIRFVRVPSGGDFTVWLTQATLVPSFSSGCSVAYSCRVGRDVIVNDNEWSFGSPLLAMALPEFRNMVVNHETGHWLGLAHAMCPGAGQVAFVMQQQPKGGSFLGPCRPNAWPRPEERLAVGAARGLPVLDRPAAVALVASPAGGYWVIDAAGRVRPFDPASPTGDLTGRPPAAAVVGAVPTSSGQGIWLVAADGGVFSFGDAPFAGSTGNQHLNQPIVGMAPTPTGAGYWLAAADGGIFTFGDAPFFGAGLPG